MTTRRQFIQIMPVAGTLLLAAQAQAQATVSDKDPTALGVGYVSDATKADKTKYRSYAPGQACGSCTLFQGQAGAATGPCPIFGGKLVTSKGWCSAYTKKG